MSSGLLDIGGDIKKQLLPFSTTKEVGKPNIFTFRKESKSGQPENQDLRLRICPSQDIVENLLSEKDSKNKDISYRLLFPQGTEEKDLSFTRWLEDLPAIQIREYLQDARINEIQNMFQAFQDGIEFYKETKDKSQVKFQKCIAQKTRNAIMEAIDSKVGMLNEYAQTYIGSGYSPSDERIYAYVMSIPYLLYTKLIASTTQNYYILPYDGKLIFDTDGNYGYSGTGGLKSMSTSSNSIIGKILNFVGASVRIDTTPRFLPSGDTGGITISVKLDLFNDSLFGALTNFIMINTLFPGNMWMQYHIISHAPNLYDIKVEGFQRLFTCTGKFQCDYKGVMRCASKEFHEQLHEYINTDSKYISPDFLQGNILNMDTKIKIPDVYSLTLTFKSLLPNNLNSYLYQFSTSDNIIDNPYKSDELYREGIGSGDGEEFKKFFDSVKGKVKAILPS